MPDQATPVAGKVDLDPRYAADVLDAEGIRRLVDQDIAHGDLVGDLQLAGIDETLGRLADGARDRRRHLHETRPFADAVEVAFDLLAEVDQAPVLEADPHRIVTGLDLAVDQEAVGVR